jgi:hypothetical protein
VSRDSTRVGQVSKQLSRVTTLLVYVSTDVPYIGVKHLTSGPTHTTWHSLIGPHQQPLHQIETHGIMLLVQTYTCQQGRGDMAAP